MSCRCVALPAPPDAVRKLTHEPKVVADYARAGVPERWLTPLALLLIAAAVGLVPGIAWAPLAAEAKAIIAGMPGFIDLRLSRSIETPNAYLLLVQWQSVEAHEVGFRGSPEYGRWRELLHEFYEPFPMAEHFAEVLAARA